MREWKCDLRVLTPMFIAGADQSKAELRPPSIRGELRYWFRALAGPCVGYDLDALHALESSVFGDTRRASSFALRVESVSPSALGGRGTFSPGLAYLAYGLQSGSVLKRGALGPGTRCEVSIVVRETARDTTVRALAATLWAWGHLGALGARSRRGFGSFDLTPHGDAPDGWPTLETTTAGSLQSQTEQLSAGLACARSTFVELARDAGLHPGVHETGERPVERPTFFVLDSAYCTIRVAEMGHRDWSGALDAVGISMKAFRMEQRQDARLVLDHLDGAHVGQKSYPRSIDRASFGLPLGFHFPRSKVRAEVTAVRKTSAAGVEHDITRRSSPLMIRLLPPATTRPGTCSIAFVHSRVPLLPPGAGLVLRGLQPSRPPVHLTGPMQDVVTQFVDALAKRLSAAVQQVVLP
jgi:CRISPR-associated protein Cmr1